MRVLNRTSDFSNAQVDESRRVSPRRPGENCITLIDGKAYPVQNWSDGGLLIQADERLFSMSAPLEVTMKFRLAGRMMDVSHRGRVIRKTRDRLAIEFEPLTREIGQKFKQVVDDMVTRQFADSQLA